MPEKIITLTALDEFKDKIEDTIDNKVSNHHDSSKQDSLTFNPTVPSGTTPTDLTGIKNGDDYYNISGGSSVIANPTLAGSEASLGGLEVDGTKYKIPEGFTIVELPNNTSGTLTQEQYNLLRGDRTILKNTGTGGLLFKQRTGNSYCLYVSPSCSLSNNNTQISQYVFHIETDGMNYTFRQNRLYYEDIVSANPTLLGTETELNGLQVGETKYVIGKSLAYTTTAPSSANTSGRLQIVVLDSEPATKYDGYLYIITSAQE